MSKFFLALLIFFSAPAWAQPAWLADLRVGGHVLYLRHASTDFSQNDAAMKSHADCASQRNLNDKGRDEARTIGESIKRLKIPIGTVLASPFCRTMETARLAFGKAEASPAVRGGPARPDHPARYAPLKKLMSGRVPKGENLVISSHANPFYSLVGPPYLAEGEVAVIKPQDDSFAIVARIKVEDWPALAP
jgi:phosphohistidine phosphatase SixA